MILAQTEHNFTLHVPRALRNYAVHGVIARGGTSVIVDATDSLTGHEFAIKVLSPSDFNRRNRVQDLETEMAMAAELRNDHICNFVETIIDNELIFIVMDKYDGGDLFSLIQRGKTRDRAACLRLFKHVALAVRYLHRRGISHGDIKAENVMLDQNQNIRLIDFGMSKAFTVDNPLLRTVSGTPVYAAPEVIKKEPYTMAADVWSAGVLLYAMVACHFPWATDDNLAAEEVVQETAKQIVEGTINFPDSFSFELIELLRFMMALDPSDRPTAEQVLEHPWMDPGDDVTVGCDLEADEALVELVESAIRTIERGRRRE